jgi:hypothetical protein
MRKYVEKIIGFLVIGGMYAGMLSSALIDTVNWPMVVLLISIPVWYFVLKIKVKMIGPELMLTAIAYAMITGGIFWAFLGLIEKFGGP